MDKQHLGASADADRATRPTDQAATRLGDTASVPSARPRPMAALAQVILELKLSEQVFRQYAFQHLDKAEVVREDDRREFNARMQKSFRNAQRADSCLRAITFFEGQGGIDAYRPASAIDAATAGETVQQGSTEGESAVPQADAQPPSGDSHA